MIQCFQTKLHTILQPAGIEYTVGDCGHLLKSLQLSDGVFWSLFEDNQRLDWNIRVLTVWGRAVPRGSPAEKRFLGLLHKDDIAVDDESVSVLIPKLRLGCLSDTGRAEEHQAVPLVVDEGTVELDHVALDGVGVEDF